MYKPSENCIIIDLDGTVAQENNIADLSNIVTREDWDKFHESKKWYAPSEFKPIHKVIDIINSFYNSFYNSPYVIFLTAREDTKEGLIRLNSLRFIRENFTMCENIKDYGFAFDLLMRKENDFRPSSIVKEDFLLHEILPNYDVILAFDDEENNIKMFQKHGITALKVYIGEDNEKN